jgi:pimeloyl-ACP methyl ester carboxylesterase
VWAALWATLWATLWAAGSAAAAGATTECRIAGLRHGAQCGVLQRALDPERPEGPRFDLHFAVLPALARRKLPDPVFVLAGGPGQSAIELAPALLGLLQRLGNRRDIVFVDQRGTGRSAPLACADVEGDAGRAPLAEQADPRRQADTLARCRTALQALPHVGGPGGLRHFTTREAMQDLDAVRARLGAERINLVGASYGTRAALEYQRQFPAHVRRSVLDGVAPPDMVLPASFAVDGRAAFDAMMVACAGEPACARRHPTLRADWQALLHSLPRTVAVTHPLTGRPERFELRREMLQGLVRGPLYSPALAAGLPEAMAQATRGDFAALVGLGSLLSSSSRRGGRVAMGMHFSVVCAEDMPLLERGLAAEPAAGPAASRGASTPRPDGDGDLAGDASVQLYRQVCADWPRGSVPAAFYTVPPATSAVLLLSGGLDPATPPRHGARVAQALGALARHVVVPNAGHGLMALPCLRDVVYRFIDADDDRAALAVDAACAAAVPRPPAFQPLGAAGG